MALNKSDFIKDVFPTLDHTGLGFIDIGSRGGVHPIFREFSPLINAIGFEPDVLECQRLNESAKRSRLYRSLQFFPIALGKENRRQTFYDCVGNGNGSFYKPNRSFHGRFSGTDWDVKNTFDIPVRPLDELASDPDFTFPNQIDFIKADTQGSELDIFHGGKHMLRNQVLAVEVEVEFNQVYTSQPLFRDVDAFLSECGFTLFKLRRVEWVRKGFDKNPKSTAGQIIAGDALYVKDPLNSPTGWQPESGRSIESLILLSVLYDLHDFATEMLTIPAFTQMVDAEKIRHYIARRTESLSSWPNRIKSPKDIFTMGRHALSSIFRFNRYQRYSTRGDLDFYSKV